MPPPSGRVLVAVATYNEMDNLPSLVDAIFSSLPSADILVVDDSSPDGTGEWFDERSEVEPRLVCLHRTTERGLGSATIEAFRYAIEQHYDFVLTMDADFSHPPEYLPALLAATESADVAIGSRYTAGGSIEGWPRSRRIISRLVNGASRYLAGLTPRDCSGAFRCYRIDALRRIELGHVQSSGFAYLEEILWHLQRVGAKIVEVPIAFRERRAGKSKTNLSEATGKLKTICRLALHRR